MQLEEYFEFRTPDEIRIKGTRVGIEVILTEYLSGRTVEEIALNYPVLSPEKIHASLTYYLRNRSDMDGYLTRWRAFGAEIRRAQEENLPGVVVRLREIARQRRACLVARTGDPA